MTRLGYSVPSARSINWNGTVALYPYFQLVYYIFVINDNETDRENPYREKGGVRRGDSDEKQSGGRV
jgi:hypothetical protein